MIKTVLSHTHVERYKNCSKCFELHYINRVRAKKKSSALVFGGALDEALNNLLLTKNLEQSKQIFIKKWEQFKEKDNIIFYKTNFDIEIIQHFDPKFDLDQSTNILGWKSFYYLGLMFIEAYNQEVLPKIKDVIAVQEPIKIVNSEGDEIIGNLDLIVKMQDDKTYLLDNKSSSIKYEENSAKEGNQLPLYYFAVKDKYNLDGIGYIVLNKKINKNRKKVCKSCGTLNESSHKSCPEEHPNKILLSNPAKPTRCNGEFEITINPKVDIQYIFNEVEESDIDRVIKDFDYVNHQVTHGIYATEHNPVRGKFGWCDYKDYFEGSPDFYILEKRK